MDRALFERVLVLVAVQVTAYGPLRSATGGKTVEFEFDGGTVRDALAVLVEEYPRAKSQLYDDEDRLRTSVRLSVNGERVDPDDECPAGAELTVFPAVQGGRWRRQKSRSRR
ncbi:MULTISPECIES: ubiquitin-like small modifier protein 1 [Halorussus]|uniref:ubiquitin-like small modifier protein 1 n=1 Tax=Halorussus TaxID=1070314 RepID=UPI000E2116CB|nr:MULTISPECIES: ubiquitin-like small modifier protein 1 [Halorussus]NHN60080.1 MoaD/ThiS family protein [Halorussus sp. JP-T4]